MLLQLRLFFSIWLLCYTSSILADSLSKNSTYPAFCKLAAKNDQYFNDFKRNPIYRQILEHILYEEGLQYLDIIKEEYSELLTFFPIFRQNDLIGQPITFEYGEFGSFSPTTLRYIKVAGDLKNKFKNLDQMHIVEIGGGYGGQCKILSDLGCFASYTIIDLPECIELTKKYLALHGVKNVFFIDCNHLNRVKSYDLVISNYAFSEIDKKEQSSYFNKILSKTPNGYLTMNFIARDQSMQSMTSQELTIALKYKAFKVKVEQEKPLTHADNVLITWSGAKPYGG